MTKRWKQSGKAAASVLAAVLALQSTAFAAPLDELNGIFEKQEELLEDSLLEKDLGLEELLESIRENGVELSVDIGLLDGTAEVLDLEDEISDDAYFQFHVQNDPVLKKWLLEAGVGDFGESILDMALYGGQDLLALTIPQFYSSAVAIRSGSFLEQYNDSALQKLIGDDTEIPDFDLSFYPESRDHSSLKTPEGKLQRKLQPMLKDIERSMQVEKQETETDEQIYSVTFETEDILAIYGLILEEYVSVFTESGLLSAGINEIEEFEDDVDRMLEEMEALLGEEFTMNFHVENDRITKIDYEIFCDPEAVDALYDSDSTETYDSEGTYDSYGYQEEPVLEIEGFRGSIQYEIVFADPERPWKTFDFNMAMKDMDQQELLTMWMTKQTDTTDTTSETSISMMVKEEGEVVYWDVPVIVTYDAATGDLDASFTITDDHEEVGLYLDSTFSQVEPGKSFVWNIDSLTLHADDEVVGITAQVAVNGEAGSVDAPEEPQMFFELSQGDFLKMMTEVSVNIQNWANQFEPESESEYDYTEPETFRELETEMESE